MSSNEELETSRAEFDDLYDRNKTVKRLACSFMCIQADELDGALVWRSSGLTVLHVLSLWTVSEGLAVSYQVDLAPNTTATTHQMFALGNKVVRS